MVIRFFIFVKLLITTQDCYPLGQLNLVRMIIIVKVNENSGVYF